MKLITKILTAILILPFLVSCGTGGLDGTYIPKNETAKQLYFSKMVFKGNKVKCYMGVMGMTLPATYEYSYSVDGTTVSFEAGIPGMTGSVEFTYDKDKQELSLLKGMFGGGLDEYAPVWGKEGTFDPNDPYPEQKDTKNPNEGNNMTGSNEPDEKGKSEIRGTFIYSGGYKYGDVDKRGDFKTSFVFSTDYFKNSAAEYNHKLAIMSLQLAMVAFGLHKKGYDTSKADNIKDLLSDMKFQNIATYGYDTDPKENSIATTIARMSLENGQELLVIAVRGGEYKQEWGGNFNVGNAYLGNGKKVHEGFNLAKEKIVADYFEKYLWTYQNELSGKKVKLWITGHSRGAAVANLLSAYFVDKARDNGSYENRVKQVKLLLEQNDIYSYCFATPNNSKSAIYNDDNYNNIKSIINPFDPVPNFPFKSWNYYKYGKIYNLPNPQSSTYHYETLKKAMLSELDGLNSSFNSSAYLIDDFHVHQGNTGPSSCGTWLYDVGRHKKRKDETMNVYITNLVEGLLRTLFGDEESYVKNKQKKAIDCAKKDDEDSPGDVKGFMGALTGTLNFGDELIIGLGEWGNNNDNIVTLGPSERFFNLLNQKEDDVCKVEEEYRKPAVYRFKEGESWIHGEYDEETKQIQESEGIPKREARIKAVIQSAREAKNNSYAISSGHYPELYLAWLKSLTEDWLKDENWIIK
jgi:hypothetical protein